MAKADLQSALMALDANETVVPASEPQEGLRHIKQLEGALTAIFWRTRFSRRLLTSPK
jgi:hypothetical protein